MNYNASQRKAVAHRDGPMMVLAGPGSGKTAVIAGRTCQLIREGISPSSILVVTFTRAAASEMRKRFQKAMHTEGAGVTFGTFHGVFYGILRNTFPIRGSSIIGGTQRSALLKEILEHHYRDAGREADLPDSVGREISQLKGSGTDPAHFYSGVMPADDFRNVYRFYENWKEENRKLDFDDIICRCCQLFEERPDILKRWQAKFRYLLIDEFQDISPMQYRIVRMLAAPENNLFIVGDDDQSIYRFRGANPGIMLGFPKDYPDAEIVNLNINYRSTPEILSSSRNLIRHNKKRYKKELKASHPSGGPVTLEIFDHPGAETRYLSGQIRKAHAKGEAYEQMAVLFRTNSECRLAVEQMMADQIPFRAADVIPCVYDHWIARQVMAYLDIAAGSRKRSDFLQIYNRPNRYLSRNAFMDPVIDFRLLYDYYENQEWMCDRIWKLERDLRVIGNLPPYGAVCYVRGSVGYEQYVREYALERNIPERDLTAVLDELCESAKQCATLEEWKRHIAEYREMLKRQAEKNRNAANTEGVMISTLHAAKGMEYDSVYILDVNEGIIPFHKAVLEEDQEEERRMLYVGMTRARKDLHLYAVRERYEKKAELSRFLQEIHLPSGEFLDEQKR